MDWRYLTKSAIDNLKFPSIDDVFKSFVRKIEPMYQKIIANLRKNKEPITLCDLLFPRLMNGQATVREIKD